MLSPPANNINCPPATVTSQTPSSFGPVRTPRGARTPARYSPTLSETYRPAVRRGRGRPPVAPGRAITPRVSRAGTLVSGSESDGMYISDGNLTDADISDLRYTSKQYARNLLHVLKAGFNCNQTMTVSDVLMNFLFLH